MNIVHLGICQNKSRLSIIEGHDASPTLWRQTGWSPCASLNAPPFPYQVTPYKRHQFAPPMNLVGTALDSSTSGYPFKKLPDKQDQLLGNVPHAGDDVGGLCLDLVSEQLLIWPKVIPVQGHKPSAYSRTYFTVRWAGVTALEKKNPFCLHPPGIRTQNISVVSRAC